MRKLFTVSCLLIVATFSPSVKTVGQGYIQFSKQLGAPEINTWIDITKVVNGETYAAKTESPDFYNSFITKLTKYSVDGSQIYSTDLGVDAYNTAYYSITILNGEVYLLGYARPVVPNTMELSEKITIIKLAANGDLVYKKYIGGSGIINGGSGFINNIFPEKIIGNEMLLSGTLSYSNGFPVTMPGVVQEGNFLTKINLADGEITRSMFIPYSNSGPEVDNGAIYVAGSYGYGLPVTVGNSTSPNTYGGVYVQKLDASDFSVIYARYIPGSISSYTSSFLVHNGELHITSQVGEINLPVTNNSTLSPAGADGFYTKLNADGTIAVATYFAVPGFQTYPDSLKLSNGNIYICGSVFAPPTINGKFIYKLNANGSTAWFKQFRNTSDPYIYVRQSFQVTGDDLYLAGVGVTADYPVTNGSHYSGSSTSYFTHLNAAGNIVFSSFLNPSPVNTQYDGFNPQMQIDNNRIYLAGSTESVNYPSTDSSLIKGGRDNYVIVLKPDGSTIMSSYIGGNGDDDLYQLVVDNGEMFITGYTRSANYPVTDNIVLTHGVSDAFLTKISFCPDNYNLADDTLLPKIQTVCKFGLSDTIFGRDLSISGTDLPVLYLNGTATTQNLPGRANYQWQSASSLTGPWTNVPGATSKDYRPIIGGVSQYFRRNSFVPSDCGSAFIHTSDTAIVLAAALDAPTVDGGSNLVTCPYSAITIGGNPAAAGGTPPYSYSWNMGLPAIANPTVSPANNTLYTLTVTDAAGCKQIALATVLVYKANAGIDKNNCAGTAVKIGAAPIAGLPGVNYLWQPATDLTSTTIAQPFANPLVQTVYDLTLTIPKTGGGTCITYDTLTVTPVAAPLTPNFAGPDKVMCLGSSVSLGTVAEPGFAYTWNPITYLTNINGSQATYVADFSYMPSPNPAPIFLSAYKNGCTFSDEVTVSTIESRAGRYNCDQSVTLVGLPDRTPNISEIYSWVKLSGTSNFTGATNLPQVPVTPFVGNSSVYELTVSFNGKSCVSQTDTFKCCLVSVGMEPQVACPGFTVYNGPISLVAASNITDAIYTWTPQVGLSAYSGNRVQLIDTVVRTYTVTVITSADSNVHCTGWIYTERPVLVPPVFVANDTTTCAGEPVTIGPPLIDGASYYWQGEGLSDPYAANPAVTISTTNIYTVTVYGSGGCFVNDTLTVIVKNEPANAGSNWIVCNNTTLTLGTAQLPNTLYVWEPQTTAWQNGTDQFSAQPQVVAITDATYTLTTTSAGCVSTDTANITVTNSPSIADSPDTTICSGYGINIGNPAINGVIYQWSPTTGLDDPTAAQPFANPTVNTIYTLIATLAGSCSIPSTDQVAVTVDDPAFDIADIHFCPTAGAIDIGASAPAGMSIYYWSPEELVTSPHIANPFTIQPLTNTTYVLNLAVRDQAGCFYSDVIKLIPFIESPLAGLDRTVCKGQAVNIGSTSNAIGSTISYSWNPVTNLNDPTSPYPEFTGNTVGTFEYVLTKTDNAFSCSVTDTMVIDVVDILPALNSPTICRNSCVQIGVSPISGLTYQWSPANGLSGTSISNPVACIDTVAATYTLTVSDQTGCTVSAVVVIGVNGVPGVQLSVPGIIACVGDNNVMFNPSVPTGSYSYLWSPDNGTLSNINILNPQVQIANPGTTHYSLQITDNATGCTNQVAATVIVNACPADGEAGNFMWFDSNENGIQDNGELGVSGTMVKLYNNVGFNVASTVTDANGDYDFGNITPGNNYYIIFGKPAGYEFTIQNVGGITASDNSKADLNGRTGNFDVITGVAINNMDAGIKPGQIVPVTLLSFTARLQSNRTVLLNWQTTAEINNAYFDVERSNDGISFSNIGRINGHGTTSLPHNYSLIDPTPFTGFNYYRLRQVDIDGHFIYSNVEVIELKNNETVTAWYDNQNHSIQLRFNNNQNHLDLKLFGSNGQLIRSAAATNNISTYTLNLPVLATGVYMLQVVSDKLRYSKKIFINK